MPQTTSARRPGAIRRLATALGRRPQRSWLLPVAGMIVGLIVAGAGLLGRAPRQLAAVPPGYVALVNGKGILMSDFMSQTATEMQMPFEQTTPAQRTRVLNEMVNEELLVQRAVVLDLPETTTEVRGVMVDAVNAQVTAALLAIQPTEAQLRGYYDAHRARYTADGTMLVHDLVLGVGGYQNVDQSVTQAQTDAAEAVYQLRSGVSISYVEEHFGFVESSRVTDGTELDFAAKLHLGARLYAVAATLNSGEVSDPIVDTDGVHVLVMEQRQPQTLAPFSAVRTKVYTDYRTAVSARATADNVNILRRQARILVTPGERL